LDSLLDSHNEQIWLVAFQEGKEGTKREIACR
jgi:hypothetical protein